MSYSSRQKDIKKGRLIQFVSYLTSSYKGGALLGALVSCQNAETLLCSGSPAP